LLLTIEYKSIQAFQVDNPNANPSSISDEHPNPISLPLGATTCAFLIGTISDSMPATLKIHLLSIALKKSASLPPHPIFSDAKNSSMSLFR
jgi:hypothetical protein